MQPSGIGRRLPKLRDTFRYIGVGPWSAASLDQHYCRRSKLGSYWHLRQYWPLFLLLFLFSLLGMWPCGRFWQSDFLIRSCFLAYLPWVSMDWGPLPAMAQEF